MAFTNAYHTTALVIRLAKIGIAELAAESGAVNSGTIFYAAVYSGIYVVLRSIVAARRLRRPPCDSFSPQCCGDAADKCAAVCQCAAAVVCCWRAGTHCDAGRDKLKIRRRVGDALSA